MHDQPAPTRTRALTSLAALGALLVMGFVAEARVWLRATGPDDYAAAENLVRPNFSDGDAVMVAPAFALRALERVGDLRGVGSTWTADGMALGIKHLWVIAEPGAEPWLTKLARYPLVDEKAAGSLRVLRYRIADAPKWHAASSLRTAEVTLLKHGQPVACSAAHPRLAGFNCPGEPDWQRTTAEWMDLSGHQAGGEFAIWGHPPSAGDQKTITWRNVQLGESLVLGGGHTEHGSRNARAPVDLEVKIGERVVGAFAFPVHLGLTTHRIDVPPELRAGQDLTITLSTRDNAGNHFAFDLGVAP